MRRVSVALAVLLPLAACRGGALRSAVPDLDVLVRPGERLILLRNVPATPAPGSPGSTAPVPEFTVVVVRLSDGKVELRIGERRPQGGSQVHSSRPGDEFRNLTIEDLNTDGRPEVVSTWTGGQLEVVEVLGRASDGSWATLLQNAGQIVEERRQGDRSTTFWITSRTYEEEPGQPPIFETVVYRWDGAAFTPATSP